MTKIGAGVDEDESESSLHLADAPKSLLEGDRVDRPELVAPYKPQLGPVCVNVFSYFASCVEIFINSINSYNS